MNAPLESESGAGSDQEHDAANTAEIIDFKTFAAVNERTASHFEGGRPVPVVNGTEATEFDEPEPSEIEAAMTPAERRSWEIRRAALRFYLQQEDRSMQKVAKELGVCRGAISRVYRELVEHLGGGVIFKRAETRVKLARATARSWQIPGIRAKLLGKEAA